MEGTISNFRRSRTSQTTNQMVIVIKGVSSKAEAHKLVGKQVTWKSPAGKVLVGRVSAAHGNSGAVRAIFSTGMPGQSIATKVHIE
jgi:large subunit ribosomal protein L35Ae